MANLQVKNVPENIHRQLRTYAQKHECSVSEFVLNILKKELEAENFKARFSKRPVTKNLSSSISQILHSERKKREHEL